MTKALFIGYSRGRHTQKSHHILVKIEQFDDKGAAEFIGRKVTWESPSGNILTGKIVNIRGGNGVLKAIFKKGLPGQAIGKELNIS